MPQMNMSPHLPFNLSVGRRLALGFASLLLLLVLVAALDALQIRGLGARLKHVVDVNNPKSEMANAMLDSINGLAIQARSVTLLTEPKEIQAEVLAMTASEARYAKAEQTLKAEVARGDGLPAERQLMTDIVAAAATTLPFLKSAADDGAKGSNIDATLTLMTKVRPAEAVWRQKVGEFIALEAGLNQEASSAAGTEMSRALLVSGGVVALAVCFGIGVGLLITRSVKRPIDAAIKVAERIAAGDLTSVIDVRRNDEIGRLLQAIAAMQQRLRELVGDIRETAESIQTASAEVATGNQDLSQRTEQTASSLQQTASSMDQLTTTVRQSADAASQANQLASSASSVASRGGEVVGQVVSTMNDISTSSKRIADIIGVIDGIAFQTNILALNAAVEAARAGEQGRGFAVVASEVRSLAQRSAEAAKEIKGLIGASVDKVESGSRLVQHAGTTMGEIVASVQRVTDIIAEITAASSEQSAGIGQINTAVTQLDQMTQQNAALVEESAAAAESLKDQARKLSGVVAAFKLQATAA